MNSDVSSRYCIFIICLFFKKEGQWIRFPKILASSPYWESASLWTLKNICVFIPWLFLMKWCCGFKRQVLKSNCLHLNFTSWKHCNGALGIFLVASLSIVLSLYPPFTLFYNLIKELKTKSYYPPLLLHWLYGQFKKQTSK